MKIFKDKKLTQEIKDETFELGIVSAGEIKQFEFWVLNDSKAYLSKLDFIVNHREVKIIEAPIELDPNIGAKLVLEWSPSITLKEGLSAPIRITGVELWRPK